MSHDIFVSHSARDKNAADAVVAHLERGGLRCWCAPRDIRPGTDWPSSIVEGINGCKAMVVVLSSSANESGHIPREVERAVNRGIPVIPVRIEDVLPRGGLEYFFSSSHWMDAITPPLEQHLDRLADQLRVILEMKTDPAQPRSKGPSTYSTPARSSRRLFPIAVSAILAAGVIGAILFYVGRKPGQTSTPASPAITAPSVVAASPAVFPNESPTAPAIAPVVSPALSGSLGGSPLAAEYEQWTKLAMVTWDNAYLIDHARLRYPEWRRAADQGDAIGEFFVGYAYQHGLTVAEDPVAGFNWFLKSAEKKNPYAMVAVAVCYGTGIGAPQDPMQYGRWIKEALDAGNSHAMVAHGIALYVVDPNPADKEEGKRLLAKAAEMGNFDSAYWLALSSMNSPAQFASRMEKAAAGGQPDALFIRAENFKGTPQGKSMVAKALKTMGNPLSVARIIDPSLPFGVNHTNLYPDLTWERLRQMSDEGSTEAERLIQDLTKKGKAP